MGRDLAAAEDQSTQAKAINIALATSAEPSTQERRTNERTPRPPLALPLHPTTLAR
jgi:hypothetical protein